MLERLLAVIFNFVFDFLLFVCCLFVVCSLFFLYTIAHIYLIENQPLHYNDSLYTKFISCLSFCPYFAKLSLSLLIFFFCRDSSFLSFMFYEVMNSVQHIFEKSKNGKQGTAAFQILAQLETPQPSFQKDMA